MTENQGRRARRWPGVLAFAVLIALAALVGAPAVLREMASRKSAICPSKGRALSDVELTDAAIIETVSPGRTVQSFRTANPRCCEVLRWGRAAEVSQKADVFLQQSSLQRLLEPYTVFVGVYYREGVERRLVEREYILDACGKVLGPAPGGGVL